MPLDQSQTPRSCKLPCSSAFEFCSVLFFNLELYYISAYMYTFIYTYNSCIYIYMYIYTFRWYNYLIHICHKSNTLPSWKKSTSSSFRWSVSLGGICWHLLCPRRSCCRLKRSWSIWHPSVEELPSGERLHNNGKSPFKIVISNIAVIIYCYDEYISDYPLVNVHR